MTAPDAPELGVAYLRFTLDHDEADAARRFAARYGQPPERIFEYKHDLCVGPIPQTGATDGQRPPTTA